MMRYVIIILMIALACPAQAQQGIRFEKELNWNQIKEKAKKEGKYIFLDGYTTWCIPCREMNMNIFPLKEVGDFFNANFINVAVQFDVTKNDSPEVKRWYAQAKSMHETYEIDSYPSYLFFNPDGDLVHLIKGASTNSTEFIEKAKQSLDPKNQYISLKSQYEKGKRDSLFLLNLIQTSRSAGDYSSYPLYINEYLSGQKDLTTKQNLQLIVYGTSKSSDFGFKTLYNNQSKADAAVGYPMSRGTVKMIAFDELIFPLIRINGTRKSYGGGMVIYSGEFNKDVNWLSITEKVKEVYPDLAEEIMLYGKLHYYAGLSDFAAYVQVVNQYVKTNKTPSLDLLHRHSNELLYACDDPVHLKNGLAWSKITLKVANEHPEYLENYINLLYKSGKKDRAVKMMTAYHKRGGTATEASLSNLEKMKKGLKVY